MPEKTKQALRVVLGARCAEARKALGLSQRALAAQLDMSASWVREVEGGAQFAPSWLLVILSEAAGLPVGWFYGFGVGASAPEKGAGSHEAQATPETQAAPVRVEGGVVVRHVLEALEREGGAGAGLRKLGLEGRVGVQLFVPSGDSLDEEDFALIFKVCLICKTGNHGRQD
jgi:transcriptional regulator with XRE-family HTH domain